MESIYRNGDKHLSNLSTDKPCEFKTAHDYYFLITPTQLVRPNANYINPISNQTNASASIENLLNDLRKVRETAWSDDTRTFSLTNNDTEFCLNLAQRIPPIGQPAENDWIKSAALFCKQFCFPGENQPNDSIVIGYWDEFEYFRHRAAALKFIDLGVDNNHTSIANTGFPALPHPGLEFSYDGTPELDDALYPPFDISMAVRLDPKRLNDNSAAFLSGLEQLQKQLDQQTIAIFEIGQSQAKIHILNLFFQPPAHIINAMRIYHLGSAALINPLNPHDAIIDSIITGRCFAHPIPPTRETSNCVVPYLTHTPPLINRAQAYHSHLFEDANKKKGIGATWLPGGILAFAEGRWVWDIAFPFDNQIEEQNSLLQITPGQTLNVLCSQTQGSRVDIEPTPGNQINQPMLCGGQARPEHFWSNLLGGL